MVGTGGMGRTAPAAEPTAALKNLFDLPLKTTIDDKGQAAIDQLGSDARMMSTDGDWRPIYDEGVRIAQGLVQEADRRLEELQRLILATDDPNELKQRIAGSTRKDAERRKAEVKTAFTRATREVIDRSKRQLDHVSEQATESAQRTLATEERETLGGLELRVAAGWWAQYSGYISRCVDEWTVQVTTSCERTFGTAMAASTAELMAKVTVRPVPAPYATNAPANEGRLAVGDLPVKAIDVPSTSSALMQYIRANVMAVGIFGTAVAVLVTMIGKLFGSSGGGGGSMLVRGGLILAILPISVFFGLKAARAQRAKLRESGLQAQRQAVQAHLKSELEKVLERHRKGLERWITARSEAWMEEFDQWFEQEIEPWLGAADSRAIEMMREAKFQQSKLNEEMTSLRTLRNQTLQALLVDLRKRQRELTVAPPTTAAGS